VRDALAARVGGAPVDPERAAAFVAAVLERIAPGAPGAAAARSRCDPGSMM
jgi:hypothetical protein